MKGKEEAKVFLPNNIPSPSDEVKTLFISQLRILPDITFVAEWSDGRARHKAHKT